LMRRLVDLLADGRIRPRIGARLAMSQAADAHRLLEAGTVAGKIVLHP
jgi:NADPH:quinone reductase-like Zn-dependent oxidoreductase